MYITEYCTVGTKGVFQMSCFSRKNVFIFCLQPDHPLHGLLPACRLLLLYCLSGGDAVAAPWSGCGSLERLRLPGVGGASLGGCSSLEWVRLLGAGGLPGAVAAPWSGDASLERVRLPGAGVAPWSGDASLERVQLSRAGAAPRSGCGSLERVRLPGAGTPPWSGGASFLISIL